MSDRPMTPDVPLRRFATAWWLLLRALNQEDIVDALVNAARELTGADGAVFAHRDGDVIGALCLLHGTPVEPDQWPTEALDLLGRDAVSREVVTAPELERRAAMAAESVAEEARRLEGLPGLVARAVVSRQGLSGGLRLVGERLGGTVVLVGPDGTVLTEAEAVDAPPGGAARLQLEVAVEGADTRLAELRLYRARAVRAPERDALHHCAAIIALELLRQRSALETEERLGRDLFRELLAGTGTDEGSLRHRASLLGVSLTLPRAVVRIGRHVSALEGPAASDLGEGDLCSLVGNARNLGIRITGWISDSDLVVVIDMPGNSDRDVRQLTGRLLKAVALSVGTRLAAGVGRRCTTIGDYSRAAAEAEMALAIARARPAPNEIVTRSELGICGLLVASTDAGELIGMVVNVLGPLLAADARSGSDYVHTLRVFHACHRHVATAAEQLHVHVNTLRHRLRRIEELLGVDLADADTRFMLELALRVHATLQPAGAA